jgi:uncharacterized membrane protein
MNRIIRELSRHRSPAAADLWRSIRAVPAGLWVLASSGWITLISVHYLTPDSPFSVLRAPVIFAFVLLCPGLAVARLLPPREPAEVWVVATALSISFGLLVSVAFTMLRNDSMAQRLLTLAVITTVATVVAIWQSARRAASTADQGVQP